MILPSPSQSSWTVGNFTFVSQNPEFITRPIARANVEKNVLPFITIWSDIERVTGHRWRCTSFLRQSPSHADGNAFDIAPDFTARSLPLYAASRGSDPVLYKRSILIRSLQLLKLNDYFSGAFDQQGTERVGTVIAIEPDHLHIGRVLLGPVNVTPTVILKWRIVKPVYSDSGVRSKLPLLN